MSFVIEVHILLYDEADPYGGGSRLAPRVGIDSRHTFVDDAVDCIALPKRDT